jgi:hypothetical protein
MGKGSGCSSTIADKTEMERSWVVTPDLTVNHSIERFSHKGLLSLAESLDV